jgi:hypothetical protein
LTKLGKTSFIARANCANHAAQTARAVNAYRLLIIDEIGYLPMTRKTGQPLLPGRCPALRTRLDDPHFESHFRQLGYELPLMLGFSKVVRPNLLVRFD